MLQASLPAERSAALVRSLRARLQVSRRKWEHFQGLPRTFGQALADPRPAFPPRSDSSAPGVPSHLALLEALNPLLLPAFLTAHRTCAPRGAGPGHGPAEGLRNAERSGDYAAPLGAPAESPRPLPWLWRVPPGHRGGLIAPARPCPRRARLRLAPRSSAAPRTLEPSARPVPEKSARAATSAPHTRTTQDRRRRSRPGSTCVRRGCCPASPSLMVRERAARGGGAAPPLHMVQPVPAGGAAPPGRRAPSGLPLPRAGGGGEGEGGEGGRGRSSPASGRGRSGSSRRGHSGRGGGGEGTARGLPAAPCRALPSAHIVRPG